MFLATMSRAKYLCYAFTLRPLNGITDKQVDTFVAWLRRHGKYFHAVTEKSGSARHLHAGVVLNEEKARCNIAQMHVQLFRDSLSREELAVYQKGITVMYNTDFILKYLNKGDDTVEVASNLPEKGHLEKFFTEKPVKKSVSRCSLYYHELEALWYKTKRPGEPVNTVVVRDFLFRMMYSERLIPVIADDKKIVQVGRHLTRWLRKAEEQNIKLAPFEYEE